MRDKVRDVLVELVALVNGECPSLLDEDSGGNARLAMAIEEALEEPSQIPPEIMAIANNLHIQDNRITSHPLFAVQQKTTTYGLEADYADYFVWFNEEDGEDVSEDLSEALDRLQIEDGEVPSKYRRLGCRDKWEFVTGCLTEEGCKAYIVVNGHNLIEPRIYAYSAYRNEEFIAMREWLMMLSDAVQNEVKK